jgi:hypothetical protein
MDTKNNNNMKIIFVDIDGPLAWGTWKDGRTDIELGDKTFKIPYPWVKEDCNALKTILEKTEAQMVLSSDWKSHFSISQMRAIFEHYNIPGYRLVDITTHQNLWNKMSRPSDEWVRAAQIKKWVKDNRIANWIAVDDMNLKAQFKYMKVPQRQHVQTNGDWGQGGRLRDKIDECINKLNSK